MLRVALRWALKSGDQLHVGLPGADPDLADEHVLETDLVGALDRERVRAAVFGDRLEPDLPAAVIAGGGGLRLPGDRDGDLLTRGGPAPDPVGDALLEHHVVAEHVVDRDLRPGGNPARARGQQDEPHGGTGRAKHEQGTFRERKTAN